MAEETRSTCPYCGVGCGVLIQTEGDRITGVRGDPSHPANFGRLCTKGSTLHLTASPAIAQQTRLLAPALRPARGKAPHAIGWNEALDLAADRFARVIAEDGPDAVGFYLSGQLLTEDYYVFNKLAKGLIGTNNLDTNSRLCMSSAVAGYKRTLGADAPPACYDDVKDAGCLFIAGSNTAWAHPIFFRRIEDAKRANPAMKIVVVDPRRTDTCEIADLHLALQPGSDVMLFHGLLHVMLREGWTDAAFIAAHTQGFEALRATVQDCTPERVSEVCGLPIADIVEAARLFATGGTGDAARRAPTLSLYCMGLNQSSHGTDKNAALINLHLATGQIGQPGAGPFSLTGQPNAMGGREVGGLSNLLPAHRDMANADHRAEVAAFWGVPTIPATPGLSAIEMFRAAAEGRVRALWIACTNPAQSMPDQALVRRALERCEFVVLQEAFATTATVAFADLLLPATTWGEKDGTVTNSERRISRVRPAVAAPGEARHDWAIAADFGRRLQSRLALQALAPATHALTAYDTPEQVWNEHRATTRGRDLDITGLSYALLDELGPQQWPMPEGQAAGTARLYQDGVFATPDGRARFSPEPWRPLAEARDADWPYALNTGRLRDQWHGMSRTGTLGRLFGHVAEPALQMAPQDMAREGLAVGDLVEVSSRRGSAVLPVQPDATLAPAQTFLAMHWGEEFLGGRDPQGREMTGVNGLTTPTFCPTSKQPELKHAAVRIRRAALPWTLLGIAWLPADRALAVRQALREAARDLRFVSCVPFGDEGAGGGEGGVLLRAAADRPPPAALVDRIEALLGLGDGQALRYADPARGHRRAVRLQRDGEIAHVRAVLLAGDTRAEGWLKTLIQDRLPAQAFGRRLLSYQATAPVAVVSRGKTVCNCFGVAEQTIGQHLAACDGSEGERLASLQQALRCGTHCGSCVPELRRMVRETPVRLHRQAA